MRIGDNDQCLATRSAQEWRDIITYKHSHDHPRTRGPGGSPWPPRPRLHELGLHSAPCEGFKLPLQVWGGRLKFPCFLALICWPVKCYVGVNWGSMKSVIKINVTCFLFVVLTTAAKNRKITCAASLLFSLGSAGFMAFPLSPLQIAPDPELGPFPCFLQNAGLYQTSVHA